MLRYMIPGVILIALLIPAASAQESIYMSLKPDSEFCDTIIFGGYGKGEYVLDIDDPGYPSRPWVDIHRASFTAGPSNPVLVPVCFSTEGRRRGDEALIKLNLETPQMNITLNYGICVSEFEDVDVLFTTDNPCRASGTYTDLFTMDLLEKDIYAKPGEKVSAELLISSDMDLSISLDKESGPSMTIGTTSVEMPGYERVGIEMNAPGEPGLYPFAITGKISGCDNPSCEKKAEGTLHVVEDKEGFNLHFSPGNNNIIGLRSATFFLTIDNFEKTGKFSVSLQKGNELESDFSDMEITIPGGTKRTIAIVVVPKDTEKNLHVIRASVEDESGRKKVVEATLTVDEALSDINRMAENDPNLRDAADEFKEIYDSGADLDEWREVNENILRQDDTDGLLPEPAPGIHWVIWIAIAGVIAGVLVYYIYKRSRVTNEMESSYYQPLDA